ncbi:hypothetical protein SAMN05660690_4469 [Geodermatophilus telluris]|uniref:Uncharacterized protein n=1 Tax=Geodermatophilus telluris TaxID=1190417 RepID=A0A1G6VFD4_9ACTN|nr:hypothetical protein [Geodermatophilus telluris]SDD51635.1 hypothetical protein SAMN05660690_4469 [Geodermatophilus telluris]
MRTSGPLPGALLAPVHRCAFHEGPTQAAAIAAQLCRRALSAGAPVVAHVEDAVRRAVRAHAPEAAVRFAPPEALLESPVEVLAEEWLRHRPRGTEGPVAVLCQRPLGDVEEWRRAEEATTAAVGAAPLAVTCLVDSATVPPDGIAMARGTHPVLWLDGLDLPNPDLTLAPVPSDTVPVTTAVLDPDTPAHNRRWWHERLAEAGLSEPRRDELVLVLHEAVIAAAALDGGPAGVPVRLHHAGPAVVCEVLTRRPCELLLPSLVPADRRLLMLWLAGKVSPAVTLAAVPEGGGARFLVRSQPPDRA